MKKLTLALILLTLNTYASSYKISESKASFVAKGFPSFIKITGVSSDLKGEINEDKEMLSGTITLDPKTLKTGMDLRDNHMKDNYLQVEEFTMITLTLKPFKPSASGKTEGVLKLHGKEKAVMVDYKLKKDEKIISVDASFEIDIVDFSISVPSFQGITVAKKIGLNINLKAMK